MLLVVVFTELSNCLLSSGISVQESTIANQNPEITFVLDDLGLSVMVEVMDELINIIVVAGPQLKGTFLNLILFTQCNNLVLQSIFYQNIWSI